MKVRHLITDQVLYRDFLIRPTVVERNEAGVGNKRCDNLIPGIAL
jgi:hypothetical protein